MASIHEHQSFKPMNVWVWYLDIERSTPRFNIILAVMQVTVTLLELNIVESREI